MSKPRAHHLPLVTLRPRERVDAFLDAALRQGKWKEGSRLPTNRELASKLRVSVPTVRVVLEKLVQEGKIRSRSGSGTFLVSSQGTRGETLRLTVGAPLQMFRGSDAWLHRMGGGMFLAALHARPAVTLVGTNPQTWGTDAFVDELMAEKDRVNGLILLPYALLPKHLFVVDAYEKAGKPVVRMNPSSVSATANFVTMDYFHAGLRLGRAWRQTGRRHWLCVYHAPLALSVSTQLRHAGLLAGLGSELGRTVSVKVAEVQVDQVEGGFRAVQEACSVGGEAPDAVYCAGERIGMGVLKALRESGRRVPEQTSVVAASAEEMRETELAGLTHHRSPLEQLGQELVGMACQRIGQGGASVPGVYLETPFVTGKTTRPEENELLGSPAGPAASPAVS